MRTHSALAWVFAVLTVLLLVPALVIRQASAAQLHVTAAPIQTWRITDGMPELPESTLDLSACGDLDEYDELVTGTAADDELEAGNGRQILVGLAGDDTISGGNHDDCLIGGDGDDVLDGGNGKDVLVGGRGADELDGGNGKDQLDAGADDGDTCHDSNGLDELVGCDTEPAEPAEPEDSVDEQLAAAPQGARPSGSDPSATGGSGGSSHAGSGAQEPAGSGAAEPKAPSGSTPAPAQPASPEAGEPPSGDRAPAPAQEPAGTVTDLTQDVTGP